jgi:2-hydroxychromene-2-carboxylate isomerase
VAPISITHFSDPGCPFAYSALPALTALQWRYGDQLSWRHVLIGLTEEAAQYEARGYTPLMSAIGQQRFRRHGMPFGRQPKPRMAATARACRLVVATRLTQPELEWPMFRALQFVQFTTPLPLDSDEALRAAAERVPGADVNGLLGRLDAPEVTEAYEADRAEARTAAGTPTDFQGKTANSDGKVRYTAPSLIFETPDGRRLEAGGFQSLGAYDVCIANLDHTLARRGPDGDVGELLEAFPYGLTTRELAQCLAASNDEPDDEAAETALLELAAAGRAVAEPLGDSTLWLPAASRFVRSANGASRVAAAR